MMAESLRAYPPKGIAKDGDWWWPVADVRGRQAILSEVGDAVKWALSHIKGRDCIIQAGGNVGVYALALSEHFAKVVACEPDPLNASCMWKNIAERGVDFMRIDARQAALSDRTGMCGIIEFEPDNCGAHKIGEGNESVVLTIDSLGLTPDAIWLDIEGCELLALQGAAETLRGLHRASPVVITEEKGHGESPAQWLGERGYVLVDRHGNDRLYKRQ